MHLFLPNINITYMKKGLLVLVCFFLCAVQLFAQLQNASVPDSVLFAGEKHFKNIQQLTFGGDNAEAYWSYDGKSIVFQRTNP